MLERDSDRSLLLGGHFHDDADGDGLVHVTDDEAAKSRVLRVLLDDHGPLGYHLNHGSVLSCNGAGLFLKYLTRAFVQLGDDLLEFARDVGRVDVHHRGVAVPDFAGMVEDHDPGAEPLSLLAGVLLGVGDDVATLDVLGVEALDVDANDFSGKGFGHALVMLLDGHGFVSRAGGADGDTHALPHDAVLDTADGNCAYTGDVIDLADGHAEGLVRIPAGALQVVHESEE